MYMPGRFRTASRPSRTVMSLASYEAPAGPFAGAFALPLVPVPLPPRVAFDPPFGDFARALLSAKKILPFVTESPERRWPRIDLRTSVGANDQVDIKDTSLSPWKDALNVTKTLQITYYFRHVAGPEPDPRPNPPDPQSAG